ncbi:MAG: ABC transporter permease [Solirubrobacteraceae bacterium]
MTASTVTTIRATSGRPWPRIEEAWKNRELLYFLALRDIKVRYAQTILGWLWTVVQPLGMTLVFTLAFSKIGNVQTEGVPYPVFALIGLSFWTFFQRGVSTSADSLVTNAALLTKTSCPRLLMPASAIASALFDLLIALVVMLVVVFAWGEQISWRLLVMPAIVLWGIALATGLGVLLAAINVHHRDVRNALPFALQLLLFLSPIAYSIGTLGNSGVTLLALNPLVGLVEAFRWSVIATPAPQTFPLVYSIVLSVVLLGAALVYFSRVAREFADVA